MTYTIKLSEVSIHAPARGATGIDNGYRLRKESFNPRARAGRDSDAIPRDVWQRDVSIHAPARGATYNFTLR